jgi:hypothetical protein
MNAIKYFNTIYSYIIMIVNNDVKKEEMILEHTHFKKISDNKINNLTNIQNMHDIESDGGYLKQKYDIESDGGISKEFIVLQILMDQERIAIGM